MFDDTLYEQLQQAMAEAEKETRRRQKAERDKIETVRRVIFFQLFRTSGLSCQFWTFV